MPRPGMQAPKPRPPAHAQPEPPSQPPQQQHATDDDVYSSPLVVLAVCLTEQLRDGVPFGEALSRCLTGEYEPPEPPQPTGQAGHTGQGS